MKNGLGPWPALLLVLATSCGQTPLRLSGSSHAGGAGAGGAIAQGGSGGLPGTGGVTGTGGGTTVGHYVVSVDGLTVTDASTGLVWQRDGSGTRAGCSGLDNLTCTWAEAQAYCAGLTLDGSGWRLPTLTELQSIVDITMTSPPAINQKAFPNTPAQLFWTSSPYAGSSGRAWFVDFGLGNSGLDGVGNDRRVRCVR